MVLNIGDIFSKTDPSTISEYDKRSKYNAPKNLLLISCQHFIEVQFIVEALNQHDMDSPYKNSPLNLMLYERRSSRIRNASTSSMSGAMDEEISLTWSTNLQAR